MFDWKPTGRKYGSALPADAFADTWAVTFHEGLGWVIVKNRQTLPWLFFKSQQAAKEVVEATLTDAAKGAT